jgi:hypothetical protein
MFPNPQSMQNLRFNPDTVIVEGEQGLQVDYWNVAPEDANITSQNCHTWGAAYNSSVLSICLNSPDSTNFVAGTNTILDVTHS